ncbi:helix-turn-helix domain-containing protein [Bacillus pacificus]
MFYLDVTRIRKKRNLTLAELASLTGIAESNLSVYANRKQAVSLKTVNRISKALGVTDIAELITYNEEDNSMN